MARKRTGTIVWRDGIAHAQVTVGPKGSTKRDFYCLHTSDQGRADRELAKLVAGLADGSITPETAAKRASAPDTVAEYFDAYAKAREARDVVMAVDERTYFKNWIKAPLGSMPLVSVKPSHVAAVIDACVAGHLKRQSVMKVWGILHRMFKAAKRGGLVDSNPTDRDLVEIPRMREKTRQRVILTDVEFATFMASDKPDLVIKMLALVSRTLGGMRTSDLHAWTWEMIDRAHFVEAFIPRSKTATPDRLEIPEMVRPFLRAKWEAAGEPESGPVFPIERGQHAGEAKDMRGNSYANRLRRNLLAAGVWRIKPVETRKTIKVGKTRKPTEVKRLQPHPSDPLYNDTASTLRVDFHSFRRAYSTALAEAGVNAQQAMMLAHHSDAKVHMRYVQQTEAMRRIPVAALPQLQVESQQPVAIAPETPHPKDENVGEPSTPGATRTHDQRLRRCGR